MVEGSPVVFFFSFNSEARSLALVAMGEVQSRVRAAEAEEEEARLAKARKNLKEQNAQVCKKWN